MKVVFDDGNEGRGSGGGFRKRDKVVRWGNERAAEACCLEGEAEEDDERDDGNDEENEELGYNDEEEYAKGRGKRVRYE